MTAGPADDAFTVGLAVNGVLIARSEIDSTCLSEALVITTGAKLTDDQVIALLEGVVAAARAGDVSVRRVGR